VRQGHRQTDLQKETEANEFNLFQEDILPKIQGSDLLGFVECHAHFNKSSDSMQKTLRGFSLQANYTD
jgi:hypothetical protein